VERLSRRDVVVGAGAIGLGLLAGCGRLPGQGQAAPKVPTVGYLSTHSPLLAQAFEAGLRDHGYVVGQTIAVEYRFLEADEQFDQGATELVRLPVDILLTSSTPMTLAAQRATRTIPIVFTQTGDPVGTGLVASLARPGGNATGLTNIGTGLASKRLQLLKETVPGLARVAVLIRAGNSNATRELDETIGAAQTLGLQLQIFQVRQPDEFESAFEAATLEQGQAMSILGDALFTTYGSRLAQLALKSRLPAIYPGKSFVEGGGLLGYGPNIDQQFRRAAYYVDRILRGTQPADLPVEQPMTFDFVVNMKSAQALGVTFPNEIMLQATEVVQ
jgi:putative tryptophan/tyrosine transport system substrate-binding protein